MKEKLALKHSIQLAKLEQRIKKLEKEIYKNEESI